MKRFGILTIFAVLVVSMFFGNVFAEKQLLEKRVKAKSEITDIEYFKTTPDAYMDHTNGEATVSHWISGGAADSFAVYFEPIGTGVEVRTIESKWYDGDGATPVFAYICAVGADCPPGGTSPDFPGADNDDVVGDVLWGPIPFSPAADAGGDIWQVIELSNYGADLVLGDATTPVPFFVLFVKTADAPDPAAVDMADYGINTSHTWIKGPALLPYWRYYIESHEFAVRAGISYIGNPTITFSNLTTFPSTYNGDQDFVVNVTATDNDVIPDGGIVLNYTVLGSADTSEVVMAVTEGDIYSATLTGLGLTVGDTLKYWPYGTDSQGLAASGTASQFRVIAPQNAAATVLLVDDDVRIDIIPHIQAFLEADGYVVETYTIADNGGWDESITTYTGTNSEVYEAMVILGFGTSTVPTRDYPADHPVASYLTAGGNLMLVDQDYFFTNGEGDNPTFTTTGEFALDFFGIEGGTNDPGDVIPNGIGVDILADLGVVTLDYATAFGIDNWPDVLTPDLAEPIMNASGGAHDGEVVGIKYEEGTFNTVLFTAPILAMNSGTTEEVVMSLQFQRLLTSVFNNVFGMTLDINDSQNEMINDFALKQNYPNPFNPETTIEYNVAKATNVELTIYNSMGQVVRTLVNQHQTAQAYQVQWNGTNNEGHVVSSGLYYYRLKAGDVTLVNKMLFLK